MKVLLESDYKEIQEQDNPESLANSLKQLGKDNQSVNIVREVIIPQLEKEINHSEHFALLQQIYHSLVLAKWYKQKVRDSILNHVYIGQNKIKGIDLADPKMKDKLYNEYLNAFKTGAFSYIKGRI